jgi:hypothetical protein
MSMFVFIVILGHMLCNSQCQKRVLDVAYFSISKEIDFCMLCNPQCEKKRLIFRYCCVILNVRRRD